MKKILLLLLAFVSLPVFSQLTGKVEFDFANPKSLETLEFFVVPTHMGEFMINQYTFIAGQKGEGQVSLSFPNAGNGGSIHCDQDNDGKLSYFLTVRGHGEMVVKIQGKNYALKSIDFEGSTGELDKVNTATNRWTASSDSQTEVKFKNGTQYTYITKLTVTYYRPPEEVILWSSTPPSTKDTETSFSEMSLKFNLPVSILNRDGFALYQLDDRGNQISESKMSLEASVSSEDNSVLTLRSAETIKEDGDFEVIIQAGALKNIDNSVNSKISIGFTIEIDRNTLMYTTISQDTISSPIPELKKPLILSYDRDVSIDQDIALYSGMSVLHEENTGKEIQVYLETEGSDVSVSFNTSGALTEPGRWILTIPEGSIYAGRPSDKDYFYNPEIRLVYTIENELTILKTQAEDLLAKSGGDQVLVGYPVENSEGRTQLKNVLYGEGEPSVEDYKAAIDAFYNETDVLLPEAEKWYKIAGVHHGDTLYLIHKNGEILTTQNCQFASTFKTKTSGKESNAFAFMVSDSGNSLHIGDEIEANGHNLSVEPDIPQFSISKLAIEGEQTIGLLKMEDGESVAAIRFADGSLSTGFIFIEGVEEDNWLKPSATLSSTTLNNPGDNLILTISGVGNVELADKTKPYFAKGGEKVSYGGDILKATNDGTQFQVNTNGLTAGVYTLVIPAGTFVYTNRELSVKDETLTLVFEIKNNNYGGPNFNYSYSYNVLQYLSHNVNNMTSEDINDITLYAYVPDEYSDMIPDTTKTVEIIKYRTLSVVATGHFEEYSDSAYLGLAQYKLEHVKAIKLKLDRPFILDSIDLRNDPGMYLCYIPGATFGDANFGKYLEDSTSVRPEDCIVNAASSSFQFIIDDANAINTPTAETFELAKKLAGIHGVGYPSKNSAAREALDAKIAYVQGGEKRYLEVINSFYAEPIVEMPTDGVYYRVTAVSENQDKAYLTYDGIDVGLTSDVTKATGFKAIANGDGTFRLQTGDGRYFKQISEAGNVSVTPSAANDITLEKLTINGVEAKKTFGMLSIKAENQYMYVDISKLAFLTPSDQSDSISAEHTNAFILEEVDKSQIYAPEVKMSLSIAQGDTVKALKTMTVTFRGAAKVDLADKSKIKLNSATEKNVGKIDVVRVPDNEFRLSFSDLPESPNYTLSIGDGAFTFTFAEVVYPIEGDVTLINIGTGITGIKVDELEEPVYDLQGRKVTGNLKSGIYIKNGKKVYIK